MSDVGFEPTPPKRLVPKTSALDHSANHSTLKVNRGISSIGRVPRSQRGGTGIETRILHVFGVILRYKIFFN